MELPIRASGDQNTPTGRYRELELQVRHLAKGHEIPSLFVYAFDARTRLGPFLFAEKRLIPGSPLAVPSALYAAGLTRTRIVLQQWNPHVRPSHALLDGKRPQMLFVSSMQIHSAAAYGLIRDAWRLGDERPLILAGGPKAIYEPWDFFSLSPDGREGADVVVTGEEFVLLELLERILSDKRPGESVRAAFERVRTAGLLEEVPGLVYRPDAPAGPAAYLINTGIQRLVQDLDELPLPFEALGLFEPPHRQSALVAEPIPSERLGNYANFVSLVVTHGCKFCCPYCPIHAYNQHAFRHKSGRRLVDEMAGIASRCGINLFFGTDDNMFNDRATIDEIFGAMARGTVKSRPFRKAIWFATEATEADVYKNQDLLPLARDGGLRSLWFGIEDMTAELIKKGQSPEKTRTLFQKLLKLGIAPMPMMVHHDGQPLWTWRGLYGLVNQVNFLRRVGAVSMQVTLLTPSVGSKAYEETFTSGESLKSVGGRPMEEYQYDGNHIAATRAPHPWRRQLNVLCSYAAFYNPANLLLALPRFDSLWSERLAFQVYGMVGLAKSVYQVRDWLKRLFTGPIERFTEAPMPKFPMIAPCQVNTALIHYNRGMHLSQLDNA